MSVAAASLPPVLKVEHMADLFGVSIRDAYEYGKLIPPCTPPGKHRRWSRDTVLAWMAQNESTWLDSTNAPALRSGTHAGRMQRAVRTENRPGRQIASSLRRSSRLALPKQSTEGQG